MPSGEANGPTVDAAAVDAAAAEPAEAGAPPASRQKLMRRADLAQLLDAKLAEDADLKDGPRAPDAWLERRLRVFERQMTSMESRQDQVEKSARAAIVAAEEAVKAMEAKVAQLQERADAAEIKSKASAIELRTALNEAVLRVQTVETVARAALADDREPRSHESAAAELAIIQQQVEEPQTESGVPVETPVALPEPPKSYLAEVRKSVAAATAAATETSALERKSNRLKLGLTRYFLGGIVVLTIFATGAGVAFSKGVSDGRREAAEHKVAAVHLSAAMPSATPLDRLTARAEAGDTAAELEVGLRYLDGPQKDAAGALHWITLAAVHGQAVAQYRLALLYAAGTGTAKDAARALQWYEAAALQGNRKAMHDLGISYAQGLGTAKNPTEAARWFSRAAGFGYVDSQFDLAVLYERGEGVPQSLLDAYKWYAVAGRQGDPESKARQDALRTQLNADDLAAAQHAADSFKAAPYDLAANAFRL